MTSHLEYPFAKRGNDVITVGKYSVPDPYQHLEQIDSKETLEFVRAQNKLAEVYLDECDNYNTLRQCMSNLASYSTTSLPHVQRDGYMYWTYTEGASAHPRFYRIGTISKDEEKNMPISLIPSESIDEKLNTFSANEVFFDPNTLSEKGEISVHGYSWSQSGRYFSYATSESGSDFQKIYVMDSYTKELLSDVVFDSRFTFNIAWFKDLGFLYKRTGYPAENPKPCVLFHKIGTPQSDDFIVWIQPGDDFMFAEVPGFTPDCKTLLFDIHSSTDPEGTIYAGRVNDDGSNLGDLKLIMLNKNVNDGAYEYSGTVDNKILLKTTVDKSPNSKLISATLNSDNTVTRTELIPHHPSNVLLNVTTFANSNYLFVVYCIDAAHHLSIWDTRTGQKLQDVPTEYVPEGAAIGDIISHDDTVYFSYQTFFGPSCVMKCSLASNSSEDKCPTKFKYEIIAQPKINGLPANDYITEQVFFSSKDGTRVPMYLSYSKFLDLSKCHPTLLYSYGGFGVSLYPSYNPFFASFMKLFGGILAVPCIRGGGEYGRQWQEEGSGINRQNSWDDFQYAAKYLIDRKYTKPNILTSYGSSNGGLLVGASMTQAPDLYGCVLPDVGIFDLLRYHLFPVGNLWKNEYGDPNDEHVFAVLRKKSPVHNIPMNLDDTDQDQRKTSLAKRLLSKILCLGYDGNKNVSFLSKTSAKKFPAVLMTTGDHDNRVLPCHSYKMAAALQYARGNDSVPLLLKVYRNQGHMDGKTSDMVIQEGTDRLVFISKTLGFVV